MIFALSGPKALGLGLSALGLLLLFARVLYDLLAHVSLAQKEYDAIMASGMISAQKQQKADRSLREKLLGKAAGASNGRSGAAQEVPAALPQNAPTPQAVPLPPTDYRTAPQIPTDYHTAPLQSPAAPPLPKTIPSDYHTAPLKEA